MDEELSRHQMQLRIHDLEDQVDVEAETVRLLEAEGLANRDEIANLEAALAACRRIGVAVGILMNAHGVSEAKAFAALRRVSQDSNVKVRDLAVRVIEAGHLPGVV
jgi:AmiR/NasT family two-component response regulator